MLKLPKADGYGNYWFGEAGTDCPVIFCRRANKDHGENGRWFLSVGGDRGVVFEHGGIKEYRTPKLALEDLESMLEGVSK